MYIISITTEHFAYSLETTPSQGDALKPRHRLSPAAFFAVECDGENYDILWGFNGLLQEVRRLGTSLAAKFGMVLCAHGLGAFQY